MKFSIGDQVLLKRTGEEGRIVAFLSNNMMEVEVSGIRFPVYADEVDHPYLRWFTQQPVKKPVQKRPADILPEKPASKATRLARGIYLSFIPQFVPGIMDDIIESFKIHFINETPDTIAFNLVTRAASGSLLFQLKATLHPFGNVYLHPLALEKLNAQPRFHWELSTVGEKPLPPVTGVLRIRPAQLVRHIREMLEENKPSFSILLSTDAEQIRPVQPAPPLTQEITIGGASTASGGPVFHLHTTAEPVLDLHIETLLGASGPLSQDEALQMQLGTLHQKLQAALVAGLDRMIIIHGVGTGVLRQKVHEALAETEGIKSFSNHWMAAYGWGATEVIFARSK